MAQMPHVCWCKGVVRFEERCDDCNELLEVLSIDEMPCMLKAHDRFVGPLSWLLSQPHGHTRRREVFAVHEQDGARDARLQLPRLLILLVLATQDICSQKRRKVESSLSNRLLCTDGPVLATYDIQQEK